MSQVVVDSSVAIKWFVVEPFSNEARRLLGDYQSGVVEFLAPDLITAEVGNIVWKKTRFQGLDLNDARRIIAAFRSLVLRFTSSDDLIDEAFGIATRHQRSVYDSMYLALAARAKVPMLTADQRLINAVGSAFPNLTWIASWP
jgi:predicted nucleic acid-binding protein